MRHLSLEKVWEQYPNKYQALNIAALEARRVIDALQRGELQMNQDIYDHSLEWLIAGKIKYERLTEAEMEALNREGYGEIGFPRPIV